MNDDDLKQRFRELRADDAKNSPRFKALTKTRPRSPVHVLVAVVPLVAAAAVFIVWCGARGNAAAPIASAPPSSPHPRIQAAAALPLDFLLENARVSVHLDANPIEGLRP